MLFDSVSRIPPLVQGAFPYPCMLAFAMLKCNVLSSSFFVCLLSADFNSLSVVSENTAINVMSDQITRLKLPFCIPTWRTGVHFIAG